MSDVGVRPRPIIVLSARTGWHTDTLVRAAALRGKLARVVGYERLIARLGNPSGASRLDADVDDCFAAEAVLARIIPNGSLEQLIYRIDALHWLEDAGVRVMNSPKTIERTVDKFYTSAILERAGLATPATVVCEQPTDAMETFRTFGDVIVKPLFGSMGLGMVRVSDEETAWRVFRALEAIRGVYYLQRTIAHDGRDVRAFVVGERVIGAIERRSTTWRTNISRGGAAHAITLPPEWCAIAIRAARAVGAEYAGVDLLPASDGTVWVLEVNGIPGWRGLQEATSLDIAGAIIDQLIGGLSQ